MHFNSEAPLLPLIRQVALFGQLLTQFHLAVSSGLQMYPGDYHFAHLAARMKYRIVTSPSHHIAAFESHKHITGCQARCLFPGKITLFPDITYTCIPGYISVVVKPP